jgi:hypothetical protein
MRKLFWGFIPIVMLCCMAGEEQKTLPTTRAIDAFYAYKAAFSEAKAEYEKKVQAARTEYIVTLTSEKLVLMKAGDLDGANAIEAEIKGLDQAQAPVSVPPVPVPVPVPVQPKLEIIEAQNGAGHEWFDVTGLIRGRVHAGTLEGYPPLPGSTHEANTLTIEGTYGDEPFELSVNAADVGGTLRFGRAPAR